MNAVQRAALELEMSSGRVQSVISRGKASEVLAAIETRDLDREALHNEVHICTGMTPTELIRILSL